MENINYIAVIVSALSGFALGAVWYGPLFGKQWMKAVGLTEEEIKQTNFVKVYGITFVLSVIAAYVLVHVLNAFAIALPEVTGVQAGLQGGFWTWLGFVLTVKVTDGLFSRTPQRLVWIDAGYRLVWLVVMGIILAVWK